MQYVRETPSIRVEDGLFVFVVRYRGQPVETVAKPSTALAAAHEVLRLFGEHFSAEPEVVEIGGHR